MISWHKTGPFPSAAATGTRARGFCYERKVGQWLTQWQGQHQQGKWLLRDHEWLFRARKWEEEQLSPHSSHSLHSPDAGRGHPLPGAFGSWLQPDFLLETTARFLLFEVKLTYQPTAFDQLARYAEWILELEQQEVQSPEGRTQASSSGVWSDTTQNQKPAALGSRPLTQIQVCRNLTPAAPSPITRFSDLLSSPGLPVLWHLLL